MFAFFIKVLFLKSCYLLRNLYKFSIYFYLFDFTFKWNWIFLSFVSWEKSERHRNIFNYFTIDCILNSKIMGRSEDQIIWDEESSCITFLNVFFVYRIFFLWCNRSDCVKGKSIVLLNINFSSPIFFPENIFILWEDILGLFCSASTLHFIN